MNANKGFVHLQIKHIINKEKPFYVIHSTISFLPAPSTAPCNSHLSSGNPKTAPRHGSSLSVAGEIRHKDASDLPKTDTEVCQKEK